MVAPERRLGNSMSPARFGHRSVSARGFASIATQRYRLKLVDELEGVEARTAAGEKREFLSLHKGEGS